MTNEQTKKMEMYDKVFTAKMEQLNIPDEDIYESAVFVADFMRDNPKTTESNSVYALILATAAYHAGKNKAE